jgi:hypothetical protein
MRRIHWTKKTIVGGVTVALLAASGGVAFAFWTAGGAGAGSATTGTTAPLVVTQTSTSAGVAPGGSVALAGNFSNPNTTPITPTSVTATIPAFSVKTDASKPACTQADYSITGTVAVTGPVPASGTGGSWTGLALTMSNAGTNQDNCKGLAVAIAYTSN